MNKWIYLGKTNPLSWQFGKFHDEAYVCGFSMSWSGQT